MWYWVRRTSGMILLLLALAACSSEDDVVVRFETNGGTEIASVTLGDDGRLTLPEDPLKEGHTFAGWYLTDDFSTVWEVEDAIPEDMTLYAKWTTNTYVITFDMHGGTPISEQSYVFGESVSFPTPTRTGHAFVGWGDGDTTSGLVAWTVMPARNVTLHAIWEATTVELVIGFLAPLSGEYGEAGVQAYQGMQMAIAAINAAGGVNGYTFRMEAYNTGGLVGDIPGLYAQLNEEEQLIAIVGGLAPGEAMAIATLAQQDNLPLITLDTLDSDLTSATTIVNRITLTEEQRHQMALAYILDGMEVDNVAILFELDDDASYAAKEAFRTYLTEQGIFNTSYNLSEDPFWYSSYISSIKFRNCDIILAPAAQGYASDFMAQANEEGLHIPFVAVDSWNYDISPFALMRILEEFHSVDPTAHIQAFSDAYTDAYEETPSRHAALGYDAVQVIAAAVLDWHTGAFTPDRIRSVTLDQSMSGLIGFTETGEAIKRLLVVEYQEGTPSIVTTWE